MSDGTSRIDQRLREIEMYLSDLSVAITFWNVGEESAALLDAQYDALVTLYEKLEAAKERIEHVQDNPGAGRDTEE